MFKVFLVDDEVVIREGMRENVKWDELNLSFSGDASDGEMALPLIQEIKPDILITDIRMPFMDGFKLSRIVRKSMPWIKIIILSGHDEFKYAKEAINIGVTEFILKPVSATELVDVLKKIVIQIEMERKDGAVTEELKKQLKSNADFLRDKFLSELTIGICSLEDVAENCKYFEINIISKYYLVVIIEAEVIDSNIHNADYSEYLKFEEIVEETIHNDNIIKFKRNTSEIVLIIKGDNQEVLCEYSYGLAKSIKYKVEANTQYMLTISIGSVRERIHGIAKSFKDAHLVSNYKFIYGKSKIRSINDVKISPRIKEFVKLDVNNLYEFMRFGSYSNIKQSVDEYMQHFEELGMNSLLYINYIHIDVMSNASKFIRELGGDVGQVLPEVYHMEDEVSIINSVERFKELLENVLIRVLEYRDNKVADRYYNVINKAKDFINNNYFDPNISLNSVAAIVNVSTSHFCTIFGKETGETFIEYLTKIRISKAKELLKSTSKRASEIAYSVGYNDPHYFSHIFKKREGVSPIEFRNE